MIETLLDRWGEPTVVALLGACIGLAFGAFAQKSRFCLRASAVELADRTPGPRLATWLLVFCSALLLVQLAQTTGMLDISEARAVATRGSLSGAILGGLMFGIGMILARGCASRLLVLSGTGNLRALLSGLVLTLVAQAALSGGLSGLRLSLAGLWTIEGGSGRLLTHHLPLGPGLLLPISAAGLLAALGFAHLHRVPLPRLLAALGLGACVCLAWVLTYQLGQISFEPVEITGITFTGPSADTLMGLVTTPSMPLSFGIGLVPGVFLGAAVMATLSGEFQIQRFGAETGMERYLVGAALMGFGSMLAGGCAVGAGVSGGAILSLTAWTAVASMWLGAMLTHLTLRRLPPIATPA